MFNFAIILSVIAGIVLLIGIGLCIRGYNHLMWKNLYNQQKRLIEAQRATLQTQRETIEHYKEIMAQGICIIPNERQN